MRIGAATIGASTLALLFAGGDLAASEVTAGEGGVRASVEEPLRSWHVRWESPDGGVDLAFTSLTGPLAFGPEDAAAGAAGLEGYEQLCRVEGLVRAGGSEHEIACLGQRGHQWGAPDWEEIGLARTVSAWLGEHRAVTLAAVRGAKDDAHAGEAVSAWLVSPGDEEPHALRVDDPRLSTTYDGAGRQRRAGLELWPEPESEFPRRAAGELVCGTSLTLGRLQLDTAFFAWRMEGAEGVGRYDILRRVEPRA